MAVNEREWEKIFTWIIINRDTLQEWLKDEKKREELIALGVVEKEPTVFKHESHIERRIKINPLEEWKETSGYFCDSSAIKIYLAMDEKNREILERPFKEVLLESKWFIFLRDTKHHLNNLANLFHEMLHIIEIEGRYHIFRGSSQADEIRDTKEIVIPLVREFLRRNIPISF
jgi:hypothetical protein